MYHKPKIFKLEIEALIIGSITGTVRSYRKGETCDSISLKENKIAIGKRDKGKDRIFIIPLETTEYIEIITPAGDDKDES
jgi:hypothetical protein